MLNCLEDLVKLKEAGKDVESMIVNWILNFDNSLSASDCKGRRGNGIIDCYGLDDLYDHFNIDMSFVLDQCDIVVKYAKDTITGFDSKQDYMFICDKNTAILVPYAEEDDDELTYFFNDLIPVLDLDHTIVKDIMAMVVYGDFAGVV